MAGLYHTLNIGEQALYTTRQGVDTASHNIANAQVEGYSRQRLNVRAREPQLSTGGLLVGSGSYIQDIRRTHNQFVEKQINRANLTDGFHTGRLEGLRGLEPIFSPELAAGVNDEVTNLFNNLQDLNGSPEDVSIRTAVRETARNLAQAFHRVDGDLERQRKDIDDVVVQMTGDISDKVENIAKLNVQIMSIETTPGAHANDLRDQRDLSLRELTQLVDINYYEDQYGMICVRGPDDLILVDRGHFGKVQAKASDLNDGFSDIIVSDSEGGHQRNVTRKLEGGKLAGLISVRDETTVGLINRNNEMAATLSASFNGVHQQGFGLTGYSESTGRNFFKPITSLRSAARDFDVSDEVMESLDAISIGSTPNAVGDNVVGNQLLLLKEERFFENGKANFIDFYANYIGGLGLDINRSQHLKDAQSLVVADLTQQREAIAGVSLDEEAVSLMKWQSNFTASSKVITTVDEMLETVLNLKR